MSRLTAALLFACPKLHIAHSHDDACGVVTRQAMQSSISIDCARIAGQFDVLEPMSLIILAKAVHPVHVGDG